MSHVFLKTDMPRRRATKGKARRTFGSQRKARATREYVQTRMARAPIAKRVVRAGRGYGLSMGQKCALLYAKSLADPSGDQSKGACLPAGFPMPSQKIRAFVRGLMSTGTTGDGWIAWTPVIANDITVVTNTTSLSTGTAATLFLPTSWGGTVNNPSSPMSKLPYTSTQITNGNVQGRLVSGCLRVRYAGNENVRSGVVTLFEDPDHLTVTGQSSNTISLFDSCGKERVSGDGSWHQINWSGPCKMAETEYISTGQFAPPCVVIAINGTLNGAGSPGPAPFEYECWQNLEFLGRDVVGKTPNHMDEHASNKVWAAAKDMQSQSEPFNPSTAAQKGFMSMVAPKEGGTRVGNALQRIATGINPLLGGVWNLARGEMNDYVRRSQYRHRFTV